MTDIHAIKARLAALAGYEYTALPDEDAGGNRFADVYWTDTAGNEVEEPSLDVLIQTIAQRIAALEHDDAIQADGLQRLALMAQLDPSAPAGMVVVEWAADTIERQRQRIEALEAALTLIGACNYDQMEAAHDIVERALGDD